MKSDADVDANAGRNNANNGNNNNIDLSQGFVTGTAPGRILVVDDDPDVLFSLTTVLRDAGYVVHPYDSPITALKEYKPGAFDLLVLDVKMSEINGFELYRKIKAEDRMARVCFLTAGETYFNEFMRLFPDLDERNYILKPVENQQLLKRASTIIDSKNQES